jgi:hypothetical protein
MTLVRLVEEAIGKHLCQLEHERGAPYPRRNQERLKTGPEGKTGSKPRPKAKAKPEPETTEVQGELRLVN